MSTKSKIKFSIRLKLILLLCGIVLFSTIPLSYLIMNFSRNIISEKTFEVCRNIGSDISIIATEELLINEAYDGTRTALSRIKETEVSGLSSAYVMNIDGMITADLDQEKIGKSNPILSGAEFSRIQTLTSIDTVSGQGVPIVRYIYPITITYSGETMRVGTAIFEFDKNIIFAPLHNMQNAVFTFSGIILLLAVIIAVFISMYFTKPIEQLSRGAEIIGEGNLHHRMNINRKDELGHLSESFNKMTSQIYDFTHNLELKVQDRTEELLRSLEEIKTLKIAQDGDYYLTSLLLEPLQPNKNSSKIISSEFYIEQKKKFSFKSWNSQIGGDICITDTIKLFNKEYTVFINGDAMGKSIQGAGGALVLGVVFNASLVRSKIGRNQATYPEIWLRERFLELHNVFLSFEGFMYISVCMGLIDNTTGVMYYFNSEHPLTILYRDNKASFIEDEVTIKKIGTPDEPENFKIRMFQLHLGDTIITGSDGRDDVQIVINDETVINEDPKKFLSLIERYDADLGKIAESLKTESSLIDDLSILKLTYQTTDEEKSEKIITEKEALKSLADAFRKYIDTGDQFQKAERACTDILIHHPDKSDLIFKKGKELYENYEFKKAYFLLSLYSDYFPGEVETIFILSDIFKSEGRLNDAADLSERLYLRNPDYVKNLIHLSDIYCELEVYTRAEFLIMKALTLDPDDALSIKIFKKLIKLRPKAPLNELTKNKKEEDFKRYYTKGTELLLRKEYQGAKVNFLRAFHANPEDNKNLVYIGDCLVKMNDIETAIRFYNRSLIYKPKDYKTRIKLARLYSRLGDKDMATSQYHRAIHIRPGLVKLKEKIMEGFL